MISLRSLLTVGGFTLLSRVLGLLRDQLMAAVVGTGAVMDAFALAFRIPNMFRRIFAEGAFSAAFVPVYNRVKTEQGTDQAQAFARQALGAMLITVTPLCLAMIWGMPWIIGVIGAGFADDPQRFGLAIAFGRIMFAYLLAMALLALFSGVLQSHGRFSAAAAAPTMLNVVLIAALITVVPITGAPGYVLAWGVAIAGVLQVAVVILGLRQQGLAVLTPSFSWSPSLIKLALLMGPGIFSAGVWQINTLIHSVIATWQDQALSYLYYSDRLYQLPLGLIGVAFGVVLLPTLSQALKSDAPKQAVTLIGRGVEFSMLLTLPAAVAMMIIPTALCSVLFEWGAFTRQDSIATAAALFMLGLGVPASVLTKVFMPAFFAREDTRTPLFHAIIAVAVSVGLGLVLFPFMGYVGLALAISLSSWAMVIAQIWTMIRWDYLSIEPETAFRVGKILICSLVMGIGLWVLQTTASAWLFDGTKIQAIAALTLVIIAAMLLYGLAIFTTRAMPLSEIKALLKRKT